MKTLQLSFLCHEGKQGLKRKEFKLERVNENLTAEEVKRVALQLSQYDWIVDGHREPRWKKVRSVMAAYIKTETIPLVEVNLA
ncbi:hypothetical protein [Weissella halotolerans]|uniref:Uncharacterized protein n=1 Tax=Weissella halotolerans DSM 20190 TaxID=1123500 RepID=A0A0R2G021_9LACO|nr:hypothetical protein [Weissella halotolerans]KRN30794.1 hypothetical protein IV68_GL001221 [Weissella halotolerans DSM 20190]